jgi:hypothetical protein
MISAIPEPKIPENGPEPEFRPEFLRNCEPRELGCLNLEPKGNSPTKDILHVVYCEPETFNRYVNLGEVVWFEEDTVAVHGICPSDSRITGADNIDIVWRNFRAWIDRHVSADEKIVLIAYNDTSSSGP